MTTKLVRVDLIAKDTWAASFAEAVPCAFGGDTPTEAIMRLLESVPELDFFTEKSEADYARTTDTQLFIRIPCEPAKSLIKETLFGEHIAATLKNMLSGM